MTDTVIKCESVYKIFGTNAKKMLQDANGNVDAKTFQENGCIVTNEFSVPWLKLRVSKPGALRGSQDVGILIERGERP